jgi:hypothetical protein
MTYCQAQISRCWNVNLRPGLQNSSIRHPGLDPESRKSLKMLNSGTSPGPDPGFTGMTNWLVLCSYATVSFSMAGIHNSAAVAGRSHHGFPHEK